MKKFTFLLLLLGFGAVLSAQTYNVTFKVNMNEVGTPFTTPEVNGNFNGWCGGCAPMSDPDLDGIWEVTIALTAGTYEYKFAYDSWTGQENLIPGTPCTVTNFGFTNRSLVVTGDATLDVVCWGSCDNCGVGSLYDITFQVNMNDVAEPFTTPEVNGNFNGWCGGCAPMSDVDGDGIWTITITLAPGTYEYKFAYDAWTGQEALTEGSPCTVTNFGFTNRSLVVTANEVLNPVCWASCVGCPTTYYADADSDGYGNAASAIISTDYTAPAGYTSNATDCNDANASVRPGATEVCNGVDDNCDGLVDNGVINSTVSASGATSFCAGSNVVLSVAAGYTSYQWKKNGANIPGATTASYTVTQGGNYSVYIASGACNTTSAITAVVVSRPKPKVTPVGSLDICLTGSVLLKGKVGIGSTYQWYKDGVLIVGAPLNYLATSVGSYKFKETTTLGCTKSVTTAVTSSCKIGDGDNANISLFPNPASESVTINFNANSTEVSKINLAIYAVTGEVIYNEILSLNNGAFNETIALNNSVASGVYLVKIECGMNTIVKTLIIE